MTFGESIKSVFSNYVTFSGRAMRSELWWFTLFNFLVMVALQILTGTTGGGSGAGPGAFFFSILYVLYTVGIFLPSLSVAVRRLHDRDKSGWWYLLVFIPIIGSIIILVWFCQKGTEGPNRFGPDPLA